MAGSHGVKKYVQGMITKCTYKNGNVQIIILYQRTKSFNHTLIRVVKMWLYWMYLQYLVANKMMATVAVLGGGDRCRTPVSLHKVCVYWKALLKLFPPHSNTTYCILLLHKVWYLNINVTFFFFFFQKFQSYREHVFLAKFVVKTFLLRLSKALL